MGDMSDPGPSLSETIDELREALEAPDDLDEELRAELRSAAEEILEALDPDHERELSSSLRERIIIIRAVPSGCCSARCSLRRCRRFRVR